jgi:ribosomal protein S6--L-glutamate ligase
MIGFESLAGDAVVKPLFGSEGRGIVRVSDPGLADRAFRLLARMGSVIYLQEFIAHEGHDLRILVIGGETFAVRRSHPQDWRTNVARGATCQKVIPSDEQRDLALAAARAVGAPLAGVDLLRGQDRQQYVIEVNAVPGWKALAAAHDEDISRRVLDFLRRRVAERGGIGQAE